MRHFLAGASFAEKDLIDPALHSIRVKEAHNAAIDKALKLLSEYIALVLFEKELEKLKI